MKFRQFLQPENQFQALLCLLRSNCNLYWKIKFLKQSTSGQEKLGAHSCRAPTLRLKQNQGESNNVYLKYVYLHIYIFVINLDLQQYQINNEVVSVSLSMHLSAFVDFSNIFIRYRTKQGTSELSIMATDMVSTMALFPIKKLFLRNENLNKFCRCLLKSYSLYTSISFHVVL